MSFNAVKAAKEFAATHAVKLNDRQYQIYVAALARAFAAAYNDGYKAARKGM